jgi:hypothetical protein
LAIGVRAADTITASFITSVSVWLEILGAATISATPQVYDYYIKYLRPGR